MNILLCNGKGGTGKTTLTCLLAYALAETGKRVSVLDLDPQHTAQKWLETAESKKVVKYETGSEYDATFIDTPPRLDTLSANLARVDLALVVASPSPADLWTSRDTAAAIRQANSGARVRLLFNGVLSHTILARDLPDLAKKIGVKPLASMISRRQCYQHAALLGWRALDPAAREEVFKVALEAISA